MTSTTTKDLSQDCVILSVKEAKIESESESESMYFSSESEPDTDLESLESDYESESESETEEQYKERMEKIDKTIREGAYKKIEKSIREYIQSNDKSYHLKVAPKISRKIWLLKQSNGDEKIIKKCEDAIKLFQEYEEDRYDHTISFNYVKTKIREIFPEYVEDDDYIEPSQRYLPEEIEKEKEPEPEPEPEITYIRSPPKEEKQNPSTFDYLKTKLSEFFSRQVESTRCNKKIKVEYEDQN